MQRILKKRRQTFFSMRGEDGLIIQEKIAYNKETVRIYSVSGDISKCKMYMLYLGTTFRRLKQVS